MRLMELQYFIRDHIANVSLMKTAYSVVLGVSRGGPVRFPLGWSWTGDWLLRVL